MVASVFARRHIDNENVNQPGAFLSNEDLTALTIKFEFNGPLEVGIAAGVERIKDIVTALPVNIVPAHAAAWAIAMAIEEGMTDDKQLCIVGCMAYLIVKFEWYDDDCNINNATVVNIATTYKERIASVTSLASSELAQTAVNILVATKVCFWTTNHHVGQGAFQGYTRKVVMAALGDAAVRDKAVYQVVWTAGHWLSTRGTLKAIGIKNVTSANQMRSFPKAAADIAIRLESFPAGTAAVGLCYVALRRMRHSVFRTILPSIDGIADFLDTVKSIRANPVAFHVGASYLGARDDARRAIVEPEVVAACSAFIHAVGGGDTIKNAKRLLAVGDVRDHPVYVVISQIREAMAKDLGTVEEKVARVLKEGYGTGAFATDIEALSADVSRLLD
jgi:hypothetical protein